MLSQKSAGEKTKPSLIETVGAFIARYRTLFAVTGAAILLFVVTLFIVVSVRNARTERALLAMESVQRSFDQWWASGNSGDPERDLEIRISGYERVSAQAQEVMDRFPRTYAATRAALLDAQALLTLGSWRAAADRYLQAAASDAARVRGGSYLSAVALMGAAVALENGGALEEAIAVHRRIVDEHRTSSAEAPRALFAIGRLSEDLNLPASAAAAYRQLVDTYPASSWTNLARTRIITLTAQGRIDD